MNRKTIHRLIMLAIFLVVCGVLYWIVTATDRLNQQTIDNANKWSQKK